MTTVFAVINIVKKYCFISLILSWNSQTAETDLFKLSQPVRQQDDYRLQILIYQFQVQTLLWFSFLYKNNPANDHVHNANHLLLYMFGKKWWKKDKFKYLEQWVFFHRILTMSTENNRLQIRFKFHVFIRAEIHNHKLWNEPVIT